MHFDVVWFNSHPDTAMRCLKVLPAEERARRGIQHPFKVWPNAPIPQADGTFKQRGYCAVVKYCGVEPFAPGRTQNGKIVCLEDCTDLTEIQPGTMAANIKPDVFERDEFKAAAEEDAKREAENVARIGRTKAAVIDERQVARLRYLAAACKMAGVDDTSKLSDAELTDIAVLFSMSPKGAGVLPAISQWMDAVAPIPDGQPQADNYDPATALPILMQAYGSVCRQFEKDPKTGFTKRIA